MKTLFFIFLILLLFIDFSPPKPWETYIFDQICPQTGASDRAVGAAARVDLIAIKQEWAVHRISASSGGPDGVRLADVNQDGLCDVVTAYESSGEVRIFQHPGIANLAEAWPSVNVGTVARGEDALGADLNADGFVDIVSSHEGDTMAIYIHWAPQSHADYLDPSLWKSVSIPASHGRGWMFAIPMDVNQDGLKDLVAGAKDDYFNERNSIGEVGWFENPGPGEDLAGNWNYHTIDHAGWPMSIFSFDVDGDGLLDLLLTDRNSDEEHMGARWLRNPGHDWHKEWESAFLSNLAGTSPTFLAVGDLNGDQIDELLIPLPVRGKIAVLRWNPVKGEYRSFKITLNSDLALGVLKSVAIGDFDLNGHNDIAISFVGGQVGLAWISFDTSPFAGAWTFHVISKVQNGKFDLVQLYDVDRDGDKDILTTEELQGLGVLWFENPARSFSD